MGRPSAVHLSPPQLIETHVLQPMAQATQPIMIDGVPLKEQLARAERRKKYIALGMVLPLLLFIIVTFANSDLEYAVSQCRQSPDERLGSKLSGRCGAVGRN